LSGNKINPHHQFKVSKEIADATKQMDLGKDADRPGHIGVRVGDARPRAGSAEKAQIKAGI